MKRFVIWRVVRIGIALVTLAIATSCYCWRAGNQHTRTCVIVKSTIDCTKESVTTKVGGLKPLVAFLLEGAGGVPGWIELLASLETVGVDVVACTAQQVNDDLTAEAAKLPDPNKPGATPEQMRTRLKIGKTSTNFEMWKAQRLQGIEIKKK